MAGAFEKKIKLIGVWREEAQNEMRAGPVLFYFFGSHSELENTLAVGPFVGTRLLNKERHMPDGKRTKEAVSNGFEHHVKIGFRTQFPSEFDQRTPVIVAVLIKVVAVQLLLDPVADGLENKSRNE